MISQETNQYIRIEQITARLIIPTMNDWANTAVDPIQRVHNGHSLIELVSWLALGLELSCIPNPESSYLIRLIFSNLGEDYQTIKANWGADWASSVAVILDATFSQQNSIIERRFTFPVTEALQSIYDTSVLLMSDFVGDQTAQEYLMRQGFGSTETWNAQQVAETTRDWAMRFDSTGADPPYWVRGYLGAMEYFDALRTLFLDNASPEVLELRRRIYGLQKWRLNLQDEETKTRFDSVTESIITLLDLVQPANLPIPIGEFQEVLNGVTSSLTSGDENVVGRGATAGA